MSKETVRYTVWSLDVLGHSHADCKDHKCDCCCAFCHGTGAVGILGQFGVDDDDLELGECPRCDGSGNSPKACECGYEVNDRSRAGTVEIGGDLVDDDVLSALAEGGFLDAPKEAFVCDASGDVDIHVLEHDGRPVYHLEAVDMSAWRTDLQARAVSIVQDIAGTSEDSKTHARRVRDAFVTLFSDGHFFDREAFIASCGVEAKCTCAAILGLPHAKPCAKHG